MKEIRCPDCKKLLFKYKGEGRAECICPRCSKTFETNLPGRR